MVKILVAGDYCPLGRVEYLVKDSNYELLFGQIKSEIYECDYSIVNLECPVCSSDCGGIQKIGPTLKCTSKAIDALKYAGFKCVTLANNHFYDQGEIGVHETIQALKEKNIAYVGGGLNLEEAERTLYVTIKNKSIAIINCCEHEFSIATDTTGGSHPLNPIHLFYEIKKAKKTANFVIVIVHGGTEWYNLPTPRMKETYRFFIDSGADVVVNHHQHCYSGYEVYHDKPIFYGLGNFCFDKGPQKRNFWNEGFMVLLELKEMDVAFDLIPYVQCAEVPTVHILDNRSDFERSINNLNTIINNDEDLRSEFRKRALKSKNLTSELLAPYTNKWLKALSNRNLIPSFVHRQRERLLLALVRCEAHRDLLIEYLNNIVNK